MSQTETRKRWPKGKLPSFTRAEKRPETKKRGKSKRTRVEGGRTEPARLYPQRAPDSKKLTQTTHQRNQAELPMRLGVDSGESGRSRTKSLEACENPGRDARQQ